MFFFDKRVRSFMSRTAITLELKVAGFQTKQAIQLKRCTQISTYPFSFLMGIKSLVAL